MNRSIVCPASAVWMPLCLALQSQGALANDPYPVRPIRWVVPFPAGSLLDIRSRFVAERAAAVLQQQVVVDDRPGAGGIIGTKLVASAPADGYTIALGTITTLAIDPALYRRLPYDPLRDFVPIALVASGPLVVLVNSALPVTTVEELVALARAKPGALTYGSIGNGSSQHVTMELFKHLTATDIRHVPYKETGAAVADLIAGRIDIMFESQPVVDEHIKAGRLRALAVTESTRSAGLPQLPTLAEAGVPGYEYSGWNGVVAPAATPAGVVETLHRAIARVLADEETAENFRLTGSRTGTGPASDFGARIRSEIAKWRKVVKTAGIGID